MDRMTRAIERFKNLAPGTTMRDRVLFASKLAQMQAEAMRLGLPITARALHNGAIRAVGWEMAGDITKAASYAGRM